MTSELEFKDKIYVIIVTYNGIRWIENCLLSLRTSIVPLHIVIVDNGSDDGTIEIITKYSEAHLIQSEVNLGFGGANNVAASFAINEGAEYLFLLNQDTIVYPNTVTELLNVIIDNKEIGVISPIHLNDFGDALDFKFLNYLGNNSIVSDLLIQRPLHSFYTIGFVNAAAWLIRADIIKEIGLFSSAFFHYGEDSNFLHRLKYYNYKLAIVPSSYINHCRLDRLGDLHKEHLKRKVEIAMLTTILNINDNYNVAYLKVLRYAGQQLFLTNFRNALKLVFNPLLYVRKYKKYRASYIKLTY